MSLCLDITGSQLCCPQKQWALNPRLAIDEYKGRAISVLTKKVADGQRYIISLRSQKEIVLKKIYLQPLEKLIDYRKQT